MLRAHGIQKASPPRSAGRRARKLWGLLAVVLLAWPAAVQSEEPQTRRLVVHPQAAAEPAFRYQLLPKFLDRLPGNAALDYNRVYTERAGQAMNSAFHDKVYHWHETPLDQLRGDKVLEQMRGIQDIHEELLRAGRRESCDWQQDIRQRGHNYFSTRLADIQQSRQFARYLAVRARAEIAEGKFDDALQSLQAGFALGQNLSRSPFLVSELVAVATSDFMRNQLETFVQQPQAPNLYWALTMLPRPLIDARPAVEGEMNALALTIPELREIDTADWPAERWQAVIGQLNACAGDPQPAAVITALTLKNFVRAKQTLVDFGYAAEAVEAMPVPKVVVLYTMKTYEQFRDRAARCYFLSYPEAERVMDDDRPLREFLQADQMIVPGPYQLLGSLNFARRVVTRLDREVALLRTVEVLRIFAAAHDGQLPKELSELSVPVPLDPVTEKPFVYELQGTTAVLRSPAIEPKGALVVEIQMAK